MLIPRLGATLALSVLFAFGQQLGQPGSKLDQFTLQTLDGAPVTVKTTGKLTAVLFVSTQCPISNDYNERMQALVNDYASRGISFVFVNSNATESAADAMKHAAGNRFTFAVHKDDSNRFADLLNAQVTPEAFLFDRSGVIIYHGAIDDSRNAANITKRPLRDALDAALAGKPVPVAEHKAFGCTIKRVKKST